MAKLILVRHGETDKNLQGKMHQAGDEIPLNQTGVEQIKKTAKQLESFSPFIVYSSQEKRALESTAIIAQHFGLQVKEIEGMQERDWGEFSGKSWDEVGAILDKMSLEERYTYSPLGGESWQAFEGRLVFSIEKLLSKAGDKSVVVVTHMGAIRALMPFLLDAPKEESFKYEPANASISVFESEDGKFKARKINDTRHLS